MKNSGVKKSLKKSRNVQEQKRSSKNFAKKDTFSVIASNLGQKGPSKKIEKRTFTIVVSNFAREQLINIHY